MGVGVGIGVGVGVGVGVGADCSVCFSGGGVPCLCNDAGAIPPCTLVGSLAREGV